MFNFILQSATDQLSVSFKYSDKESGVDHFKAQIYEVAGGTRRQKYPGWFLKYEALLINTFIDYLIISFKFKLKLAKCKASFWKATLMHFMLCFIHAEDD